MKKSLCIYITILSTFILGAQGTAWGWGALGHHAVGIIAEKNLSPKAKSEIQHILSNATLPQISTWPDSWRPQAQWRHTASYHFADIRDGENYLTTIRESDRSSNKGDVVRALMKAEAVLSNKENKGDIASLSNKAMALAFLVHFMGDIHQPFHAGRPEDRGGNSIPVNWFGKQINLHSLWDTYLFETSYADQLMRLPVNIRAKKFVGIIDHVDSNTVNVWLRGSYDTWLQESIDARSAPYTGFENQEWYRQKYIDWANQRVLQAGYRLAAILTQIFAPTTQETIVGFRDGENALNGNLSSILGPNFLDRIRLAPGNNLQDNGINYLSYLAEPDDLPLCEEEHDE